MGHSIFCPYPPPRISSRIFFHFALWKVLDFDKELQYHPYPTLDFASVEGMDGLGFLEKIAVSSNIHT